MREKICWERFIEFNGTLVSLLEKSVSATPAYSIAIFHSYLKGRNYCLSMKLYCKFQLGWFIFEWHKHHHIDFWLWWVSQKNHGWSNRLRSRFLYWGCSWGNCTFNATLQAAMKELHVDVKAFKQCIEKWTDEVCKSNGPLAEAVIRLQEENQQLRGELETLSHQVESLTGRMDERCHADVKSESIENANAQMHSKTYEEQSALVNSQTSEEGKSSQSIHTYPEASSLVSRYVSASSCSSINIWAPPPWRAKRHTEINVSKDNVFHRFCSLQRMQVN